MMQKGPIISQEICLMQLFGMNVMQLFGMNVMQFRDQSLKE